MSRLTIRDSNTRPANRHIPPGAAAVGRKKGTGVRPWLMIDTSGQLQLLEAGKHAIMKRTGLPARDLRILDPLLSYPSTLLGRERAVVINLEHIKAIITAQEVLLLNSKDPTVSPFVDELQRRIVFHHRATSLEGDREEQKFPSLHLDQQNNGDGSKILPFEFVALEACLESACTCLDLEAKTLEQEAHPALDKLTSKISTLNLERVRQIKSRLVALSGRVQKVRDELEHLLDDDDDMAEMYLTEKLVDNSSNFSVDERDDLDEENLSIENLSPSGNPPENVFSTRTRSVSSKRVDVDELEMLLEAYFIQIDGIMNKLSTLREYVDDTEDYINIMLDDKQNHLLQMGVMLTTATLILSCFVVLAGIFGMNISIDWFKEDMNRGVSRFLWTVCSGTTGSLVLYVSAIAWYKHKRLLE